MTLDLRQRFARGIVWNLLSAASAQGSTFLVNIALAHLLGREVFGRYAVVLGSVQSLAGLAALALGYTATRYLAELRVCNPARAGRVLGFCLGGTALAAGAAGLLLALFAPTIAVRILADPGIVPLLRMAAATAFLIVMCGVCVGALAGLEAYRALGMANAAAGVSYLALCLGLASRWGLRGAVTGLLLSALLQFIILVGTLVREARLQGIRIDFSEVQESFGILKRFALPSALAGVSVSTAIWLGQLLVARQPDGYEALAGYVAGFNLMTLVLFLPSLSNTVGTSVLNSMLGHHADYRRAFWFNFRLTCITVVVAASALALLRIPLLSIYGAGFKASGMVLLLLALGSLPEAITTACAQLLQSREVMWQALGGFVIPRDVVFVALALYLVPQYRAEGLAMAYLVSRLVAVSSALFLVRRLLREPLVLASA